MVERFPLDAVRERWACLLGFAHATLPPPVDYAVEGDRLVVVRQAPPGRPVSGGRIPDAHAPSLFLQAAAALSTLSAAGTWASASDLMAGTWDVDRGAARFWLGGTPSGIWRGGPAPASSSALTPLLERLFGRRGRVRDAAAAALLDRLAAEDAPSRRAEFWVAAAYRFFPSLSAGDAGETRLRTIGQLKPFLRTASERAVVEKGRGILRGREVRVFEPGITPFEPGSAFPPARPRRPASAPPASPPAVWICVAPETWDLRSRQALAGARAQEEDVEILEIASDPPQAVLPDEWRAALFVPCGAVGASLRFYERLSEHAPAEAAAAGRRMIEGPYWAAFASDPTGDAPLPDARDGPSGGPSRSRLERDVLDAVLALDSPCSTDEIQALFSGPATRRAVDRMCLAGALTRDAAGCLRPGPQAGRFEPQEGKRRRLLRRWAASARSPGRKISCLLAAGEIEGAVSEAAAWRRSETEAPAPRWFELSARLAAALGPSRPSWLELWEAEREMAGGRPEEAEACLARIATSAGAPDEDRRLAQLRRVEVAAMRGRVSDAAASAEAWRKRHPAAPPEEVVRALRIEAAGASRLGEHDRAFALLEDAELAGAGLPPSRRIETALVRAGALSRAGRFREEAALYASMRIPLQELGDDAWTARFLAAEALGLSDRREFGAAVARLEEAIAILGADPVERARLSIDLAATLHHARRDSRASALLRQAAALASAAGRADLERIARSNLVQLALDAGDWDEASAGAALLLDAARRAQDPVWTLVSLHHRGRLALRTGRIADAEGDNAEARALATAIGDRLEIGELWLEDGDIAALCGDSERARRSWTEAASDPPDRDDAGERARRRLAEQEALERDAGLSELVGSASERLARGEYSAAEDVARWTRMAPGRIPEAAAQAAELLLRERGGALLADVAFGKRMRDAAVDARGMRRLRDLVSQSLTGEETEEEPLPFGLTGLSIGSAEGGEVAGLGGRGRESPGGAPARLHAGSAEFVLRLSPQPPAAVSEAIGLMVETLLFRRPASAPPSEFARGWQRIGVVTADSSMEEPYRRLVRFAPRPMTVMILGESGSGKEAVARAVHSLSARSAGAFVAVNVSAIPGALLESELFGHARGAFTGADRDRPGLLEEAVGGTVFFDEIGDLAAPLQAKLLRALQEGEIRRVGENRARRLDVRVVSATARDLEAEVEAGRFREDLFYRLHVAVVQLPPLRERGRDVLLLARHFLLQAVRRGGPPPELAPEATAALLAHSWPGNVRELQSAIASAAALADGPRIELAHLPGALRRAARPPDCGKGYRSRVNAHRRDLIMEALEKAGGNRSRAARELQLSRQALLYLIRELRVPAPKALPP